MDPMGESYGKLRNHQNPIINQATLDLRSNPSGLVAVAVVAAAVDTVVSEDRRP